MTVGEGARLTEAARLLGTRASGLVVACDRRGRMVGVVSKTDIVARLGDCLGRSCEMAGPR